MKLRLNRLAASKPFESPDLDFSLKNIFIFTSIPIFSATSEKSNIVNQILIEVRDIKDPIISNEIIRKLAQISNVEEDEIKRIIPRKSSNVMKRQPPKTEEGDTFDTINDKAAIGLIKTILTLIQFLYQLLSQEL